MLPRLYAPALHQARAAACNRAGAGACPASMNWQHPLYILIHFPQVRGYFFAPLLFLKPVLALLQDLP